MTSVESICTLEPPTPDIFESIDHKGCESSNPEGFHAQAQKPGKLAVFKLFSPMGNIYQLHGLPTWTASVTTSGGQNMEKNILLTVNIS